MAPAGHVATRQRQEFIHVTGPLALVVQGTLWHLRRGNVVGRMPTTLRDRSVLGQMPALVDDARAGGDDFFGDSVGAGGASDASARERARRRAFSSS
jgi:hypothetical protein